MRSYGLKIEQRGYRGTFVNGARDVATFGHYHFTVGCGHSCPYACTGLVFDGLSRAKRIADLIVQSVPFDGVSRLGSSRQLQARVKGEVRLKDLAQSTFTQYTQAWGVPM